MKRKLTWLLVASVTAAGVAMAGGTLQAPPGDPKIVELLSGISFAPNKTTIDLVMGVGAVSSLIQIAQDDSKGSDPGVRIRAFRALGEYPGDTNAKLALSQSLNSLSSATSGVDLLYLRAAVMSLAQVGQATSVSQITPLLSHESRDIRAASAQALALTHSPDAIQPLRNRSLVEEEAQVQIAIADALFVLESGP